MIWKHYSEIGMAWRYDFPKPSGANSFRAIRYEIIFPSPHFEPSSERDKFSTAKAASFPPPKLTVSVAADATA
jgi:hypothetical protein